MDSEHSGKLEDDVRELRARVQRLEHALDRQGILAGEWRAPSASAERIAERPAPVTVPASPPPSRPSPVVPPPVMPRFEARQQEEPERSLESRIGSQWFNRIGIFAVLIGMAWFLKYAIDNHWIGPTGRVLIGLLAGIALIVWSERFRARGYAAFSYSLKAVGSGILYLSLWAAFSLYHLVPGTVAFFGMIAVTAFNGFLAWMQDSELLAVYAIGGAFCTPMLVSTGQNHEITLFSYALVLDVAVLILVALRPWSRLLTGAFFTTAFYAAGWYGVFYTAQQFGRTAFFFACFFLLFALAPRLARIDPVSPEAGVSSLTPAWDQLATILLPVLNAGLGFFAFYELMEDTNAKGAEPWVAVAFAAFYLLLLRLPGRGRWRNSPFLLSELHLAFAVVFLTIAIPLKASGRWITIGWLAEGAALLWAARRARSVFLRALALLCLALALVALLILNPSASATPLLNQRFATYLAAIGVFTFVAWLGYRSRAEADAEFDRDWPAIAASSVLIVNCLILIAVSLEIHAFWWGRGWAGGGSYEQYARYRMYAQFTYSAFFMAFGAVLLALGFSRHSAFLRWQALVLLAISIGKVFVVDTTALSQGYRILSFLALGALLLGVSFAYQRDWFNLRGHGGSTS